MRKSRKNNDGETSHARSRTPLTRRSIARLLVGGGLSSFVRKVDGGVQVEYVRRVIVRYRSDAGRIARLLPPPLVPDVVPDILVSYLFFAGRGFSPFSVAAHEEYGYFMLQVAARYGRRRGMVVLGAITDHEWGRIRAREYLGLPVKPGKVSLSVEGTALKVFCHFDGHRVQHLETVVSARSAHLLARWRSTGFGSFVHRYAPGVNTSQSVVDLPVELWRVSGPIVPSDSEGMGARVCDISQTKLTWGSAAWADDNALPVREFVGAAYQEFTGAALSLWQPWNYKQSFVSEVDPSQFAPWVLSRYDHPSSFSSGHSRAARGKVLVAGKLAGSDMLAYRRRGEDRLGPMSVVDVRVSVDPKHYAKLLPPGCEPVRASLIRLLVLRVEQGDFSSRPFQEAWLFALCHVENSRRWYAVSHVVGNGGEFLLGRERFGYPTLKGRVGVGVSATDFHFSGSRYGYEFVRGAGSFRRFSTGLTLSRLNIVSLRARPFRPDVRPQAELIGQTWFLQGRLHYADLRTVELVFSDGLETQDNASDPWSKGTPWFGMGQSKVISAEAMEDAYMQRGPGHVVRDVPDFEPFYRERCDGVLPHEALSDTGM